MRKTDFMKFIFILNLMLASALSAKTLEVHNADYKSASLNSQYIRFDLASWKMGLFKSTFKSYVLNFKLDYQQSQDHIQNGQVYFKVHDMNTDVDSRNDKMWQYCLNFDVYPDVVILFKKDISLKTPEIQDVPAMIKIRGQEYPIHLKLKANQQDSKIYIQGEALTSLKELGIPDPSIAIASLEDSVKIFFKVENSL